MKKLLIINININLNLLDLIEDKKYNEKNKKKQYRNNKIKKQILQYSKRSH